MPTTIARCVVVLVSMAATCSGAGIHLVEQSFIPGIEVRPGYRYIRGLALSPDDSELYAAYWADSSSDPIGIYSTATYSLLNTLSYGRCHGDVVVSADGKYLFTPSYYEDDLSRFRLADGAWAGNSAGSWPAAVAISPDGTRVVAMSGMEGTNYDWGGDAVYVYDGASQTFSALGSVALGNEPCGVSYAFSEDSRFVYVPTARPGPGGPNARLYEVSVKGTLEVTRSLQLNTTHLYGVARRDNALYVSDGPNAKIWIVDLPTFTVTGSIALQNAPRAVAMHPDEKSLFVLCPDAATIDVFDTITKKRVDSLQVRAKPWDIEFSHDGSAAYVAHYDGTDGGVSVLNTAGTRIVRYSVPEYRWNYGCTPTSAGMVIAYWDRIGFGDLVSGDPNLDSSPQNVDRPRKGHWDDGGYETGRGNSNEIVDALIASKHHHQNWWAHGYGPEDPCSGGIDPKLDDPEHNDCLADYMGTSQGGLYNGGTTPTDADEGMENWAKAHGYPNVRGGQDRPAFSRLCAEINADRPVLLHLLLDGDANGHTVVAYGYRDLGDGDRWFAVHDTWMDGDSDGKHAIEAFEKNGVEWWKWNTVFDSENPLATVFLMTTFRISHGTSRNGRVTSHSDGFNHHVSGGPGTYLGYHVTDTSPDQSGTAEIAGSPLDANDPVLVLTSITGDAIAVSTEIDLAPLAEVGFDYLFDGPGKLELFLSGVKIGTILAPESGAGSPASGEFARYFETFDLVALGLDPLAIHEFEIALSGAGDPTAYLDNLEVVSFPEPATVSLLALGAVAIVRRRRR